MTALATAARRGAPHRTAVGAVLLVAATSATVTALSVARATAGPVPRLAAAHASTRLLLEVTGDPAPRAGRTRGSARRGPDTVVVPARVVLVGTAGHGVRVRSPVVVIAEGRGWLRLLPSERVRVVGRLLPTTKADRAVALVVVRGPPQPIAPASLTQRTAGRIRTGLRDAVAPLPPDERGLLPGLVIGDVSRLPESLRADFRAAGLTHLVAVSGANVAIVLAVVVAVTRRTRLPLRVRPAVAVLAILGFVVLARPSPSVLRAAAMGLVVVVATTGGRRTSGLPALAAAVVVLLVVDPPLAAEAGFALSVAATAGLLVVAPRWRARLARRLPQWLADAIAVPAAAQLACAPLLAGLFGQLSLVAVPANLLAAPAVAPATVLGVAAALLAPLALPLAQLIAVVAWLPTAWLAAVAHACARVPAATVTWPTGVGGALLLAAATVGALVVARRRPLRRITAVACTGVLLASTAVRLLAPAWPPPGWALVVCDVGQGDGLVVAAGGGSAVVVDAGPDPGRIDGCLRSLHIRAVPLVVLTHLHADHVEGLPGVLRHRSVGAAEVGPLEEPPEEQRRVRRWLARARVPTLQAAVGETRRVGPVSWQVLAPSHAFHGTSSDPNNSSVVVRLTAPGVTALLTGDVEPTAQRELLATIPDLRADVLKVPHHGSDHQEPEFLDAVHSRFAIASVGAHNTYGHPSPRTLARLAADGAGVFRTDRDGTVAFFSRGGQLVAVPRHGSATTRALGREFHVLPPRRRPPRPAEALVGPVTTGAAIAVGDAILSACPPRSRSSSATRTSSSHGRCRPSSPQRAPPMPTPRSPT